MGVVLFLFHKMPPQTTWHKWQKSIVSQVWRLEVQDRDVGGVGLFCGPSPRLADSGPLTVSSHGPLSAWARRGLVSMCLSSFKGASHKGLGSTLTVSFNLMTSRKIYL